MKIIGRASKNFIMEMEENELANLIGHYYANADSKVQDLKPGDQIQVGDMYTQLRGLRAKASEIRTAQKMLIAASGLLELVDPLVLLDIDETGGSK